jgi:hypothetical protein
VVCRPVRLAYLSHLLKHSPDTPALHGVVDLIFAGIDYAGIFGLKSFVGRAARLPDFYRYMIPKPEKCTK